MSPRAWLLLFIGSILISGEALIWALAHGQFHNVERGRFLPLRAEESPLNASRRHPWRLAGYVCGLIGTALALACTVTAILVVTYVIRP